MYWRGEFQTDDLGENPNPSSENYQRFKAERDYFQFKEKRLREMAQLERENALLSFYEKAKEISDSDYLSKEDLTRTFFPDDFALADFKKDERLKRSFVGLLFSAKFAQAKKRFERR